MGSGSFSRSAYADYSLNVSGSSRDEVFTQRTIYTKLDPNNMGVRESRDSADHPESTPIIVLTDVTGSMGSVPHELIKNGVGRLIDGLFETLPVKDPQILFGGIGDIDCDRAPLQVTQFESDNRMVEQLADVYLEGRGGGNDSESYDLAWYFAAYHTSTDSFNKRGKKGYLFTTGDEMFPRGFSQSQLRTVFGTDETISKSNMTADEALAAAQESWEVFHLIIEQGSYFRQHRNSVTIDWREHMGRRAILVDNHEFLPEVITAILRVSEGENPETVLNDVPSKAAATVRHALFD